MLLPDVWTCWDSVRRRSLHWLMKLSVDELVRRLMPPTLVFGSIHVLWTRSSCSVSSFAHELEDQRLVWNSNFDSAHAGQAFSSELWLLLRVRNIGPTV